MYKKNKTKQKKKKNNDQVQKIISLFTINLINYNFTDTTTVIADSVSNEYLHLFCFYTILVVVPYFSVMQ